MRHRTLMAAAVLGAALMTADDPEAPTGPGRATGGHPAARGAGLIGLAVGALGVVFGDIGTSPLYALQTVFALDHPAIKPTKIQYQNPCGSSIQTPRVSNKAIRLASIVSPWPRLCYPAAGCCCVMQCMVPSPSTRSRQAMPITSRSGKRAASVLSATRSFASLNVGTRTILLAM